MDPFAHTFTGAALVSSGLRRATPLATAALLIGANIPDIDIVMMLGGDHMAVAHRRGWTHGIPAVVALTFALTWGLLLWDRHVRLRRNPNTEPARAGPLLLVAAIGVISHPILDWLNNYGMRWLMPFDGHWTYGDALFIIDPWVWLIFGGVVFLAWSRRPLALAAWGLLWFLASWLILDSGMVPDLARWIWLVGVTGFVAVRLMVKPGKLPAETVTRGALAVMVLYMGASVVANVPARTEVRTQIDAAGLGPVLDVMVGPVPANPLRGLVVADTGDGYYLGSWSWLDNPRLRLDQDYLPSNMEHPAALAAAADISARRFLIWARYPFAIVEEQDNGYAVAFGDARYHDVTGPAVMPLVHLDLELRLKVK